MDQGGLRLYGLKACGRPHTAPRLGDPPPLPLDDVTLLGRSQPVPPQVLYFHFYFKND